MRLQNITIYLIYVTIKKLKSIAITIYTIG